MQESLILLHFNWHLIQFLQIAFILHWMFHHMRISHTVVFRTFFYSQPISFSVDNVIFGCEGHWYLCIVLILRQYFISNIASHANIPSLVFWTFLYRQPISFSVGNVRFGCEGHLYLWIALILLQYCISNIALHVNILHCSILNFLLSSTKQFQFWQCEVWMWGSLIPLHCIDITTIFHFKYCITCKCPILSILNFLLSSTN